MSWVLMRHSMFLIREANSLIMVIEETASSILNAQPICLYSQRQVHMNVCNKLQMLGRVIKLHLKAILIPSALIVWRYIRRNPRRFCYCHVNIYFIRIAPLIGYLNEILAPYVGLTHFSLIKSKNIKKPIYERFKKNEELKFKIKFFICSNI